MTDHTPAAGELYWRVRVVVDGALLHLASRTEPRVDSDDYHPHRVVGIDADWIAAGELADRLGYLDLEAVSAVSWRRAVVKPPPPTPEERLERIRDAMVAYVRKYPGASWSAVRAAVVGRNGDLHRARDELIAERVLVNVARSPQRFELLFDEAELVERARPDDDPDDEW